MFKQSMRRLGIAILLLAISLSNVLVVQARPQEQPARVLLNLTQYVNPLIGTGPSNSPNPVPGGAGGSTIPGPLAPFGMIQFSPDTNNASPSGYGYNGTEIQEFSLTHFNGAGCPNNEDIGILPITGALGTSPGNSWTSYASNFSHTTETAAPGYYKVTLSEYGGITTELTATTRSGFARFTFPSSTSARVLINTSRNETGERSGSINISGSTITGTFTSGGFCGNSTNIPMFFAAQFDRTPTGQGTFLGGTISNGSGSTSGVQSGGFVTFDTTSNPVVQMKIAISYVSLANAQQNLSTENPNWDFNAVRTATDAAWNTVLNRIQVSGGSTADLTKFYTALYHVFSNPNIFSDVNGQYKGSDNVVRTSTRTNYQNYSGWDIIRSWTHLVSAIAPETPDMIDSMVQFGVQRGLLPFWSDRNVETNVMVGDPGTVNVANAYAMGVRGFDTAAALSLMDESGNNPGHTQRLDLGNWINLHYVGNAAISEEYAMADFALSQYAQALGNTTLFDRYNPRAQYWRNHWNAADGYLEPRITAGGGSSAARIYEFQVFGPSNPSTNLALNKPATASASCGADEGPEKAVNGTWTGGTTDKWCDNSSASKWWRVDLGSTQSVNQFVIHHSGAGGESAGWNTRAFTIQVSTDGSNWTTVVTVTNNTANTSTHNITAANARYVRLNISEPIQSSTWDCQPFNPAADCGYIEGNGAQYLWMVPHNMRGLFDLLGGNATAVSRLDNLFTELNAGTTRPFFYIGNEPEHNTPWAYNFALAPWKTQNVVRRIINESFTTDPGGLPGNDDLGATSAWLVWSYLGLYPMIPGTDVLVFNGPMFPSATVFLANGNTLQINGTNAGQGNQYIQSLTVNGVSTTRTWVSFSEISGGATLNFTMGSSPNTSWGSNAADAPPSFDIGTGPTPTPTKTNTPGPSATPTNTRTPTATSPSGTNLALNKPATASASCNVNEGPEKAVNGSWTGGNSDKWCDNSSTSKWLQVDLGANFNLTQFVIRHAGAGGESTTLNTSAYNLQVSTNGTSWTTVVTVTANTSNVTTNNIAATNARYVRLNVTAGTQGTSTTARIYEVEVYGGSGPTSTPTNTPTRTPTPTVGPSATATFTPTSNNDLFANAASLGVSQTISGTNQGATTESGEPTPCGSIGATLWYRLTPSANGSLTVSSAGSNFDTVLALYSGTSLGSLTNLACNDDFGGTLQSQVSGSLVGGQTYYLQVGGYSGATGNIALQTSFTPSGATATATTPPSGTNLALNKPATASASCNANEGPEKAVNGSWTGGNSDKWCDSSSASKWWQVDLGANFNVNQFVIRHAGAGGESTTYNTRDFNLQVSTDGTNWTTVVTVTGNTANTTTNNIAATNARYVRLNVTAGEQSGSTARIYEVEVYGN